MSNEDGSSGASLTLPIVVLTLLGIGTLALWGGTKVEEEPAASASASAAAAQRAATPSENAPPPTSDEAALDTASERVDSNEPAEPLAVAAPPLAKPEPTPEPEQEPKPKREPKPLSANAQRKALRAASKLGTAIADGRVRRSAENFAAAQSDGDASWADATATCAALQVDGVRGWKLPSRGEARELQRGHALPSGALWTRQRAHKYDDSIYVHDTRTRRSAAWLDVEIAGVVCVQPSPRDPQ